MADVAATTRRERVLQIVSDLRALGVPDDVLDPIIGVVSDPVCSGHCVGTASAETLVEDLTCPIHGIAAQERAEKLYPNRQAWLASL